MDVVQNCVGMVMTLETLDNPIFDKYIIDDMVMTVLKIVDSGNGVNATNGPSFMDYPCFNDVSKWFDIAPIETYVADQSCRVDATLKVGSLQLNTKKDDI